MKRMDELELQAASCKAGGEEHRTVGKNYGQIESSLLVNSHAHGFYMGARKFEEVTGAPKKKLFGLVRGNPMMGEMDARKMAGIAADYYIKQTFPSLSAEDRAMVAATVSRGFVLGVKYRRELFVKESS